MLPENQRDDCNYQSSLTPGPSFLINKGDIIQCQKEDYAVGVWGESSNLFAKLFEWNGKKLAYPQETEIPKGFTIFVDRRPEVGEKIRVLYIGRTWARGIVFKEGHYSHPITVKRGDIIRASYLGKPIVVWPAKNPQNSSSNQFFTRLVLRKGQAVATVDPQYQGHGLVVFLNRIPVLGETIRITYAGKGFAKGDLGNF